MAAIAAIVVADGEHDDNFEFFADVWSGLHEYTNRWDRSCLPKILPRRVRLGKNLWGCVLEFSLSKRQRIGSLTWECTALETIGALLGISYQ